jgi:hypothetical protein
MNKSFLTIKHIFIIYYRFLKGVSPDSKKKYGSGSSIMPKINRSSINYFAGIKLYNDT